MQGANSVRKRKPGGGRKPLLNAEHLLELRSIVSANPTASLAELTQKLQDKTSVKANPATVRKALKALGVKRQVVATPPAQPSKAAEEEPETRAESKEYRYDESHRYQGEEAPYPSSLTEAEWLLVCDLFEVKGRGKPPIYSRRLMVNAMLYVVRGGIPWRMLPSEFPPWHLVFKTFQRWAGLNRFELMYDRLRGMVREREGRAVEPSAAVIDSQSIKTSAQGGPKGYDAGKKVKGRKRHLVVDTLGLLLAVIIHPASISDPAQAPNLIGAAVEKFPTIQKVYADGSYAGKLPGIIRSLYPGVEIEISRRSDNRNVGIRSLPGQLELPMATEPRNFVPLPTRWVVERSHAWNDRLRRLAKDHDRSILSSTAWIWFGEARMLLRRLTWDSERQVA